MRDCDFDSLRKLSKPSLCDPHELKNGCCVVAERETVSRFENVEAGGAKRTKYLIAQKPFVVDVFGTIRGDIHEKLSLHVPPNMLVKLNEQSKKLAVC